LRTWRRFAFGLITVALVGGATAAAVAATGHGAKTPKAETIRRHLTPSSPELAACMPHARVRVRITLSTEQLGADILTLRARGLPHRRDFTLFLLEQAATPFGAAEYIGDFSTNRRGRAHARLRLIVQEAFSSTLVNGTRVRVDLNQIGAWFADPEGDDFCLGPNSPVTPFDGDNEAGVQAFNSANAAPLPAP
jgi:hypothetical protein